MPCQLYIVYLNSVSIFAVFEDKPFLEEDHFFAVDLFQGVSPFLLSQILGLPMDQWKAIETASVKDQQKQLSSVLQAWRRSGATANWSDLVETLTELGLRGKAQTVCLDKGISSTILPLHHPRPYRFLYYMHDHNHNTGSPDCVYTCRVYPHNDFFLFLMHGIVYI